MLQTTAMRSTNQKSMRSKVKVRRRSSNGKRWRRRRWMISRNRAKSRRKRRCS